MTTKISKSEDPMNVWSVIEPCIPAPVCPDFTVKNEGTIYLLTPLTNFANTWVEEHISDDAQWWGRSIIVEHRFIRNILAGITYDGLTFSE